MLRFSVAGVAAVIGLTLAGVFSGAPSSLAHEHRAVGNYQFVVGFLGEPALAYEPNGLSLRVTFFANGVPEEGDEAAEAAGQPVEGLEETLQAEVIVGGGARKMEMTLEPAFGDPGAYETHFIPTLVGDYTFHVFGKVEDKNVDESFTSSPEGFSSVEDVKELEFPEQLPTTAELKTEIDQLKQGGNNSGSSDDTARILGIIGIIAGVIGAGAGGFALASRRL